MQVRSTLVDVVSIHGLTNNIKSIWLVVSPDEISWSAIGIIVKTVGQAMLFVAILNKTVSFPEDIDVVPSRWRRTFWALSAPRVCEQMELPDKVC